MHDLNTAGLQFPLKYSDTAKFENIIPSISDNVLVFENNEVFYFHSTPLNTAIENITSTC